MKQTFSKLWLALALMLTFGATASADDAVFNLTKETVTGGTLTLKVNGSEASTAAEGATVTVIAKPESPLDKADITITSNMQWGAAHSRRLAPADPSVVKTYEVKPVAGKAYTYEFTMPANDVIVSALFSEMESLTQVPYIDAEGNEVTTPAGVKVYKLDGTEGELGVEGQTTWYVVQSALTYTEAIKLNGATNIIVTDGGKMSIGTAETPISNYCFTNTAAVDFSVFGQKGATGQFGFYNTRPQDDHFDDVVITSCNFVAHSPNGLYCKGNLTTWGANVTSTGSAYGLGCWGNINVTGGKLTATSNGRALYVTKDLNLTNCEFTAETNDGIAVQVSGNLSITGGKATVKGIYSFFVDYDITITDCEQLTANGSGNDGLYSQSGKITIEGSKVNILSAKDAISANQGVAITQSDVTAEGSRSGIAAQNKDITITQSNVVASGGYCGIEANDGQLSITGGKVTAKAPHGMAAINGYKGITIEDCVLTATSSTYGLFSMGGQEVSIDGGQVTIMGNTFGIYTSNNEVSIGLKTVKDFVYVSSYYNSTVTLNQRTLAHDGLPTALNPANSMLLESGTVSDLALVKDKTLRLVIQGSISFLEDEVYEYSGETITNTLRNNGDGKVTYSSSNESIATVDPVTGEVTIVGPGEAVITATVKDGLNYHYEPNTASFKLIAAPALSKVLLGYTAKDGVVYALYEDHATVVGVVESALPTWNETGKKITIVDKIAAKDGDTPVPVVTFSSDWTEAGWYQNGGEQPLPNPTGYQPTTDPVTGITTYTNSQQAASNSYTGYQTTRAKDIKAPIYMLIRASRMASITRADVNPFKIQQFTLGEGCGITRIPAYLFAPMKVITSAENQGKINQNDEKIAELERQVTVWTADQANNASEIAYWTDEVNKRKNAVDKAETTQWWKTQEGELENLHKQLVALEGDEEQGIKGLKQLIIELFSVWQDASDEIVDAVAANPSSSLVSNLTADEKKVWEDICAAMLKANISPNGDGGYDLPMLPTINSMINRLKNETIPNKENSMNSTKMFTKEGYVSDNTGEREYSMNDLKNRVELAEEKFDEIDKSDDIADNEKEIKKLQEENSGLVGDLSVLDPEGKNETLKQVNLYDQQLVTVGEGAFANCVNAKFGFKNDKFDAALKLIKEKAFLNTLLEIVDLSEATDENLDVKMTAFQGTPLKTLKLKGIQSKVIGPQHVYSYVQNLKKVGKDLIYTDGCGFEYKTLENTNTNNTLTTVTLPETEKYNKVYARTFEDCIALPSIEIPAQVTDIDDKAFENCIALATVTFAGDKIAHIGEAAFFRTAVPAFDFSNQFKLATIGDYAFAANCALTTVNLPADKDKYSNEQAPLKALFAHTFKYSPNLTTVTFNGNMFYLAEGLFDSNKLEVLDLSKTKVLVLNDLFHAGQNHPVTDENGEIQYLKDDTGAFVLDGEGKKITLYRDPVNTTLKSVILPEGLLAINNFALAGLQCPKFQEDLVIPSSVVFTGVGAFRNSTYVKNIKFPETTQQFFERGTFEQCLSLQTVELFVEEALYTPSQAFTVTTANRAGFTAALSSAYNKLLSKQPAYNNLYGVDGEINLPEWMTTTNPSVGDPLNINSIIEAMKQRYNVPFRYYSAIYRDPAGITGDNQFGQWMDALGGDGWYGEDSDWNSEIFIGSLWGFDDEWFDGRPGHLKATIYVTPNDVLQLRADGYEEAFSTLAPYPSKIKLTNLGDYSYGFINKTHGVWVPYKTEDGASVVVYSAYQDGNNVILHPAKIKNGYYKVAGYDPEDGAYAKGYYWVPDNADWDAAETLANAADRASAAVIRVEGNVKEIPYLAQHSRSTHTIPAGMATYEEVHIAPRFMSTLDTENELQILDEDVYPATNMNWYKFGVYQNEVNFWYVSSGRLAAGNVAFQGIGVNGLTRLNAIFVDQNEATAVLGIKEYRDMMQNGTIYNLQGVKVTAPVKGQMYIQNGRKFVAK